MTELAHLAHERGVINDATRNGIEGVAVMHTMALLDQARLTETRSAPIHRADRGTARSP